MRLEPLRHDHRPGLTAVGSDPEISRWLTEPISSYADMERYVERALANAERGTEVPFATIERSSETVIGSTRLLDIQPEHRSVEIGYTWLGPQWWRTSMNSESKYLLLRHLFDELGYHRVALKTDRLNERSQRAIERLGAVREGVLRKHMIVHGGRVRDTVYYSILDDEWPAVRRRLEQGLYGHPGE